MKTLTELDYAMAAKFLNCEIAVIKAVKEVESAGSGFLPNGKPKILFEGHWFYKYTNGKFGSSNVSYPNWVRNYYNEDQHERLDKAAKLDRESALKSASWGMFQIMGFNHNLCSCKDVYEFVHKMSESHEKQLELMYYFMNTSGCLKNLKEKDWAGFARKYNGPGYAQNAYDQKLRNSYENFKDKI